jgi:hypothetical protein
MDWQTFSVKDQEIRILDTVGHTVWVITTQLCCRRAKAAIDNTKTNEYDCVPIKHYLQNQAVV